MFTLTESYKKALTKKKHFQSHFWPCTLSRLEKFLLVQLSLFFCFHLDQMRAAKTIKSKCFWNGNLYVFYWRKRKIRKRNEKKRDIYIYFETPHIDKSIVETLQLNRLKGKFSTYSSFIRFWRFFFCQILSETKERSDFKFDSEHSQKLLHEIGL